MSRRKPEKTLSEKRERYRRDAARRRAFIAAYKTGPCVDCGVQYPPYVMDFDHVRGKKEFRLGSGAGSASLAKIVEEIAKCDLVCSNCHRFRTFGPGGHKGRAERDRF